MTCPTEKQSVNWTSIILSATLVVCCILVLLTSRIEDVLYMVVCGLALAFLNLIDPLK